MIRVCDERSTTYLDNLTRQGPVKEYLSDLQEHHHDTHEHSLRVALLSIDLGYENHLTGPDLRTLGYAALLHDMGKTEIAESILSKQSSLDEEERGAVDTHPRRGFIRLEETLYAKVKKVAVGHHEYHTSAYPRSRDDRRANIRNDGVDRRMEDESIARLTQILAVADMCDALASPRSYKEPLSKAEIQTILAEQFTGDRLLVQQVLRRL